MQDKNKHDRQNQDHRLTLAPLAAIAIEMFGGVAMLPTPAALKLAGWPGTSDEAICLARREQRLPVVELKCGSRFYVTAGAFAEAFLTGTPDPTPPGGAASAPPARRGRGRPHKYMLPSEDAA
ncbi:MAG TPA: hypothetical protein VFJ87_12415 [Rhodanobacteraceae bacterium]|nr:hypothetical protein [Rhodanobacteraceae bacterium]